jgi:hypothetical protein
MPECRKRLVLASSKAVPAQNVVIGENCHIVAKRKKEARAISVLTPKERDRYPNLILLCRNHHRIIDADPVSWPVEKLHQIKADHELWVETRFSDVTESISSGIYSDLVNTATEALLLSSWDGLSDHAVRFLLSEEFVNGVDFFGEKVLKTIWPNEKPELESVIKNLSERASSYVATYMSKAKLRPGKDEDHSGFWVEDKWWKRKWSDDYHEYAEESKKWERKCLKLLFNVVVALNEYSDKVRKHLKPTYFMYQGKFVINDAMGVMSEMKPTIYVPTEYFEMNNEEEKAT